MQKYMKVLKQRKIIIHHVSFLPVAFETLTDPKLCRFLLHLDFLYQYQKGFDFLQLQEWPRNKISHWDTLEHQPSGMLPGSDRNLFYQLLFYHHISTKEKSVYQIKVKFKKMELMFNFAKVENIFAKVKMSHCNKPTLASFSNSGANIWQWPHQGAKKSTNHGVVSVKTSLRNCELFSSTTVLGSQ